MLTKRRVGFDLPLDTVGRLIDLAQGEKKTMTGMLIKLIEAAPKKRGRKPKARK